MNFSTEENELIWRNLNLYSGKKHLLQNISGIVGPSSMTALMGPSGAGKTTLLNALAGRLPLNMKLSGEILLNSYPRDQNWPQIMGYVEQEFLSFENQTVFETLNFCKLIKNSDLSVDDVINILGLVKSKNDLISKLSGGEKKRLSMDSFNALNILELLIKLAKIGKTIIVTIHQPSYNQIQYFQRIILLSQGKMIYEGSFEKCIDFFKECGYNLPRNTNPTDFFLDTISLDTRNDQNMNNCYNKINYINDVWMSHNINHNPNITKPLTNKQNINNKVILPLLIKRNILEYWRKKTYLKIKILQKLIFLLIFGLAYLRMNNTVLEIPSRKGSLTFLILNCLFGICAPIFNVFPDEKRVIIRERRSGMYSAFTSFLSKYISELPFNLIYEISYLSCLYWIIGLNSGAGRFFICLIIYASLINFSIIFGLAISSLSPSQNIAQIIGGTCILFFTIYSGAFGSTNAIPAWLRWMIFISPVYYAFTALIQNQFSGVEFYSNQGSVPGEEFIYANDTFIIGMWWCIFLMWLYTVLWFIIGSISLQYSTRTKIKLEQHN
ncbi:ABC transporter [Vairimorpha necatrix]|uniref:ABC transporter n=1 Tax=Vairimorpha necatrix TaxID=6039 RepID=A0AAX4JG32_9MICR